MIRHEVGSDWRVKRSAAMTRYSTSVFVNHDGRRGGFERKTIQGVSNGGFEIFDAARGAVAAEAFDAQDWHLL